MRQITFLCERALNSLEYMSVEDLIKLQQMSKKDFEEAFLGLGKAENEEVRDTEFYWKLNLEQIKKHPVPFDNEHVHAVTHVEKHKHELEDGTITSERLTYLITSFGMAMQLSCQLYLTTSEWIKKKS